jgi:hypothetical protein
MAKKVTKKTGAKKATPAKAARKVVKKAAKKAAKKVVKKATGAKGGRKKPGRPHGSKSALSINITQFIFDTVIGKKRFVHNREILEAFTKKFPKLDRVEFGRKISVLLASLKKQGRLSLYNDGGYRKNMYWGSPTWMSGRNIKPGYKFKA